MRPVMGRVFLGMVTASLGSAASLMTVGSLALVVHVIVTGTPIAFLGRSWAVPELIALSMALTMVTILARSLAFIVSHFAASRLERILRTEISEHMAKMPLGAIISSGTGALKKILLDDVRGLHVFVADSTPLMGRSVAGPIMTLILMCVIDWRLAIASLVVLFGGMCLMRFAMKDSARLRQAYDACNEDINAAAIEFVQAMPVVRTFDTGSSTFKRYQRVLERFREMLTKWIELTSTSSRLAVIILGPLPTLVVVTAAGILLYAGGHISFSVLMAFWLLSTGVAESLMPLMWLMTMNRAAEIGAIRISDFLSQSTLPEVEQPQKPDRASIEFDRVEFTYPNRDTAALSNASFHVGAGQVVALVGPSGSGKSTVARLIPRFYDVTQGTIRVGGADIRQIPTDELMAQVSFVFQDTFLFHESIRENIRVAKPGATDAEIEAVARQAMAHDFIMEMPQGYDTIAGDRGTRLSGGQRQRITIARAMLRDAPILVLDEATAFADPESEAMIIAALARLMQGRTVLIIAHRLSTIKDADHILVLDRGHIVEQGTHGALVQQGGLYATLWNNHDQAQNWRLSNVS